MPFAVLDPDLDQGVEAIHVDGGNATSTWTPTTSVEGVFSGSRVQEVPPGSVQIVITQPIETPLPSIGAKIVSGATLIGSLSANLTDASLPARPWSGSIFITLANPDGTSAGISLILGSVNNTGTPTEIISGEELDIFAELEGLLGNDFTIQDVVDNLSFAAGGAASWGDGEGGTLDGDTSFISLKLEYAFALAYSVNPPSGAINPGDTVTITSPGTDPDEDLDLSLVTIVINDDIPVTPTVQTQQTFTFIMPPFPPGTTTVTVNATSTQFSGTVGLVVYSTTIVDGSGIYHLVLNKTSDTVYIDAATGDDTEDLPIPQPWAKTGFIGG